VIAGVLGGDYKDKMGGLCKLAWSKNTVLSINLVLLVLVLLLINSTKHSVPVGHISSDSISVFPASQDDKHQCLLCQLELSD